MRSNKMKIRYIDDISLLPSFSKKIWAILLLTFALGFPLVSGKYFLSVAITTMINIIAVLGLNLLTGTCGQISIGNAAFFAIGAYTAGSLALFLHVPFWISVPAGAFVSMLVGVIVGVPALRIKGFYLLLATFALHYITVTVAIYYQLAYISPSGLRFPVPEIGPMVFDNNLKYYYLLVFVCILAVIGTANLLRSQEGRCFMAVRDHAVAASIIGVNVARAKIAAFALSSFYVGFAGGLMGYYSGNISAEMFSLSLAIDHLAMVIIGGMGTITGAISGVLFVTVFPHLIPDLVEGIMSFSRSLGDLMAPYRHTMRNIFMGIIILGVLMRKPEGINGLLEDIKTYFRSWPYR